MSKEKKVVAKKVVKKVKDESVSSGSIKLKKHASRHINAWYEKYDGDRDEFAKYIASQARLLLKSGSGIKTQ